jgi:putative transposase
MMSVLLSLVLTLRTLARSRAALQLEILALRHQPQVLQRSRRRLRLARTDRWLWALISRVWTGWRAALVIVKPDTVIAWHRQGFRPWWAWKSRRRMGRPTVPADVRALIRTMAQANPRWGAPRIHGELLKLGIDVCQASVAKYMVRQRQPPSQTWRTFLRNHIGQIVAADFFVVPTATYRLLFVLVLLAHDRRRIRHVAVTAHPTAAWTAQQLGRRASIPAPRSRSRVR